MKNKHFRSTRYVLFLFAIIIFNLKIEAQDHLKNLTRIEPENLENTAIVLDGVSFPVYDELGQKMEKEKVAAFFVSGAYIPELYIDKRKNKTKIKAAVFKERKKGEKLSEFYEKMRSELERKRLQEFIEEKESIRISAPNFVALDMQGTEYAYKELKGKVIVLNFWFTGCKPCIKEFPELNEMVKKYKNNKEIVFLAFTFNTKEQVKPFLEKHEFLFKIIPDSKKTILDFDVFSYPNNMIINRKGNIVFQSGFNRDLRYLMEKKIDELIN